MRFESDSKVCVVGSLNFDLVFRTPSLPQPGQTILGGELSTHSGGKGGNQAVAIAKLGGAVDFVGQIGADAAGEEMRQTLSSAGVGIDFLGVDSDKRSGTATVMLDDAGMNMIIVAPGANMSLTELAVSFASESLQPDVTLSQLEIPMACVDAASKAKNFILNPAPASTIPAEILERVWILTPNETELFDLTGIKAEQPDDCLRAGQKLLDQAVQNVVITLGSRGSCLVNQDGIQHFEPRSVKPVDTTAAGDAFNGALAHFLAAGRDLPSAIKIANCVGALATTKLGAQASMPTLTELKAFAPDLF